MELDLRHQLRIVRRRWWIVLMLVALIGAGAYLRSSRQTPMYSASATLLVISGQLDVGNDLAALQASRSLAETYRLLIETGPVLNRVVEASDLPYDAVALQEKLATSIIGETQLVEVTVTDADPEQSAHLANSIAEAFQEYITVQVDPRIGAQVELADPALVPTDPFQPQPLQSLMLGLFMGLLLGVGVVALLEFLDNRVKPEVNIPALAGAPLLATISAAGKLLPGSGQVYTLAQPRSGAAEAMRLLRTNLEFASATATVRSITVTSPGAGEGKSTIVANLGVAMAQAGLNTVIIDADLRKPTQATIFGVVPEMGLTTLLTQPEKPWEDVAQRVALPGLQLVASGPLPPNPSDLVSSLRFESLLERVTASADMVIIDSPPLLSASDALAVANHTDGVLLVCQSHRTRSEALRHAANAIHQGGIRLVGVVVNRQKGQQGASYYGEYYGPLSESGDRRSGRVGL